MPDNPIKHSDIIQKGNPFDETIKGINDLLKLFKKLDKEVKTTAKDLLAFSKKQNAATKEGRKNIQAAAKATAQLTIKEKEALKIKKQLETAQAKLALAGSKENRQLIATREALKLKNAELRKSARAMQTGIKNTNKWGGALKSFQFKFNALGNIAANVLSRMAMGLQRAVKDSIMLAAKAEGVTAAFRNLGRPGLLKELQKATRGTVDNLTLMQAAVQAKNFKIPLERLGTFFDFATSRAIQTGESVDYLVNSIITGIGRKSVLVMDNLGISAAELQDEVKKVGDFGQAAGNIIERSLREAGDVADTTATFIAQINTGWTNLKTNIGDSKVIMFALRGMKAGFEDLNRLLNRGQDPAALTSFLEFTETIKDKEPAEQIEAMTGKTDELRASLLKLSKERRVQQDLIDDGRKVEKRFAKTELEKIDKIQIGQIELLRIYEDQLSALKTVSELPDEDVVKANTIKAFQGELKKLTEQRDLASFSEVAAINREIEAVEKKIRAYQDAGNIILPEIAKIKKATDDEFDLDPLDFDVDQGDDGTAALIARTNKEIKEDDKRTKAATEAEKLKQAKIQQTFDLANRLTSTFTDIFASQKAKELSAAGDNAEKRAEIEKKYAKKEQILAISQAAVDGASSILKTKSSLGLPFAIPFMIADAAITAAQIGVIASQKFGEGEVDIDGPSHSRGGISAEIEGGESVINKHSTSKYGNLLEAINANDTAAIANAALQNSAFHDVWGRTRSNNTMIVNNFDPNIKKMREIMENTPIFVPDGPRKEYYPGQNKTRIING